MTGADKINTFRLCSLGGRLQGLLLEAIDASRHFAAAQ